MGNSSASGIDCQEVQTGEQGDGTVEYLPNVTTSFARCCQKQDDSRMTAIVEVPVYSADASPDLHFFGSSIARRDFRFQDSDSPYGADLNPYENAAPAQNLMSASMTPRMGGEMDASLEDLQKIEAEFNKKSTFDVTRADNLPTINSGVPIDPGRSERPPPMIMPETDPSKITDVQCCCCPSVNTKPEEKAILERPTWCAYCCCFGYGCDPSCLPCHSRADCACCHLLCESAYCSDQNQGCCSINCTLCVYVSWICQLPLRKDSPMCICANSKCCWYGKAPEQVARNQGPAAGPGGVRRRRASVGEAEEAKYVVEERFVPCLCCCCACTESYGKNICGHATKCCCSRCDGRCGAPCYPGMALLSTCCCQYAQCRFPKCMPGTPCLMCCTFNMEELCKCRREKVCKRLPRCCENFKCCSCTEICPYVRYVCCCRPCRGLPVLS